MGSHTSTTTRPGLVAEPLAGRDLAAFVAAVETGSVQGAADLLCLSQSGATKRIQSLERRLGTPLLRRLPSGVVPTDAGRRLFREGHRALDALWAAERCVAAPGAHAPVRLAASYTVGEYVLPRWLGQLRSQAPAVHLQVHVVNSPRVLALLREGHVEVGFVEGDDALDGFDRIVVGHDEIVAVVRAGHRWTLRKRLPAAELVHEPYVAREPGSGTRTIAERRLARAGVALTPDVELASLEAIKGALLGGGFTLMSRLAVAPRSELLRIVPVEGVDLRRKLVAVRAPHQSASDARDTFWSFLGHTCGAGSAAS